MLEFARQRFALDKLDPKTGKSQLQTYLEIRKQTGVVRRELREMRSVPVETEYIWNWYTELSARRGAGFQVNAISWSDIWAFFQLRRISPEPWEVDTLCLIDSAYLSSRSDDSSGGAVANATGLGGQVTGKKRE